MAQGIVIESSVVHGKQLGRRLGFPTANLSLDDLNGSVPQPGVYAARCLLPDGRMHWSMVNIGFRPTVDSLSHQLSIEAHLLDFEGDLYGKRLRLSIVVRIRDERKMETLEQLQAQLAEDLASVKDVSQTFSES